MEERQMCLNTMNFLENWDTWRSDLSEMVSSARESGDSEEKVREMVIDTLDFLAKRVCPESSEDQIIAQMWNGASPEDRKTLADLILRIVGY